MGTLARNCLSQMFVPNRDQTIDLHWLVGFYIMLTLVLGANRLWNSFSRIQEATIQKYSEKYFEKFSMQLT